MDFTTSYEHVVADAARARYSWCEVRNAAAILATTNPVEFHDLLSVLAGFNVVPARDITPAGGNESLTAAHLNRQFRQVGWREGSYDLSISSTLRVLPWAEAGEVAPLETTVHLPSPSYLIDNVKGRVALDVEWHAKDGNLDRDIAAYRTLYDAAIIDGAVMITMVRSSMRKWALALDGSTKKFMTSTTTNLEKLKPRLSRGDGGGCPILVAAIGRTTR